MTYAEYAVVEEAIPAKYSYLGQTSRGPGLPAGTSYHNVDGRDDVYRIEITKESPDTTDAVKVYASKEAAETAWGKKV